MYENLTRMRLILTYKVTRFKAKLLVISKTKMNRNLLMVQSWYIVFKKWVKTEFL